MALDPLRFAIEIVDQASTKLTNIKTLIDGLNNKEITVNVQGNLKEVLDILSKSGTDANALSGLQNALSGALSALEGLGNAARNGDLGTFSTEVGKAAAEVNGLAAAFEKMNVAVGSNEQFKSFMTGVGELVSRTNSAMKQLNSVGGNEGGNDSADKGFLSVATSIEKARYELYQFDNLIKSAESASRLGKQFSDVDTNGLDKAIEKAKTFREELEQISRTGKGKEDRRFDKFALQADYKEAVAEVRRLVGETETLETSQRRYNTILQGTKDLMQRISNAQDSAQNIGAQNKLIGKFSEAYDFKQRLQSLSDSDKANAHIISELAAEYTRLAQSLTRAAKEQEKLNAATEKEKKRSDDDRAREIQRVETNQRRLNGAYEEAGRLIARLEATGMKGLSLGLDVTKVDEARNQLVKFQEDLVQFGKAYAHNNHTTQETIGNFNILRRALVETANAQEQMNTATEKANKEAQRAAQRQQEQAAKQAAEATKRAQQENEAWANSMKTATNEANKLDVKIRELQRTESGAAPGVNTSQLRSYINDLRVYRDVLKDIAAGSRTWGQAGTVIGNNKPFTGIDTLNNTKRLADEAATAVKRETDEIKRNQAEKQKAAGSTSQLTAEEQRLAQALNQTTEHARGQSQVLSDLKSMAMQYLGVWGGQQFLRNIIEIGGQLEMQRLSIGAILQNQGQANELFERIKGLAVQSPFGVVELDQMTKQLTAYGFKYNELFDMTKRLADISAATGTGVDRLALALGHVRSEAALSGYTLRQFSMANVPLLQKLSEKLGKTTQEIRKMVRSKEISYEDVEGIIKDLTNDGGMFYNMQETISQSVKARFKNVKDAMDIMYGEMAESGIGGLLKDVALLLMELTKNWKTVGAAVTGAVAPMVLYKAAMWATSKAVSANVAYTGQFTAKQLEAQAITGNLSKKLLLQAVASGRLSVANAEAAAATLGLTRAQLQWVARSGNVAAATNKATLATSKFTVAQLRSLAVARDGSYSFMARNLARLKFGFGVAGSAAKAFGATLAGLARSFLPLAAISAVFAMISRSVEASSKAQETAKDIAENARDTQKSINSVIQEQADDKLLKSIEKSKFSVNGRYVVQNAIEFNDAELNKTNLTERIKSLREELQNLSPLFSGDIIDINEAETQVEQYKVLVEKLESLRHVNDVNEATSNVLPNANKRVQGGNWFTRMFGDSFTTDLTDYSNRMEDSVEEINQISEVELDKIDKILNGKLSKIQGDLNLSSLGEALKLYFLNGKRELENGSTYFNAELYKVINSNGDKQTLKDYYDSFFDPVTFGRSLSAQRSQVLGETKKMSQAIASTINTYFKDDPEGAVYALKGFFDRMFSEAGVTDNSVMQETINKILDDMREMSDKGVQAVADDFQRKQVMIQFSNLINPGEIEGAKTEKELDALFQKYLGKIQEWAKILGIDLEKLGLGSGGKFFGGFRKAFNAAKNTEAMLKDWQKRAGKVFELNTEIKVKSKTITDMDEFAQAVQKDLKEKQEYIARNASHIKHTLTINAGIKFNMDKLDTKALNDMIIELGTKVQVLLQQGKTEAAKSLNSVIQDELIPFRDVLASIDENKKWLKSEGYPEKDPTKDKSKNKSGTGSKEDKNAKAVRERVRILKEAADAFEYWNKKLGPTGAWERVNEQFGDVLSKIGVTIDNVEDLRGHLKAVTNSKEYKAIKDQKVKLEIDKEIAKDLDQLNRKVFEKSIDEYKSKFTKTLDDLTRRWETFNAVRQATGSRAIALDLAGISEQDRDLRNAADALKRNLADEMQRVGGNELIAKIPFSIDIDEEKLRDQFKAALGDSEKYAATIDGLVEAYKRWQKAQQDATKADIDAYAKIIGLANSYDAQLKKINNDLQEQLTSIAANPLLSEAQKAKGSRMAQAIADWKKMKLSADYANLHNRAVAMSAEEYERAEKAIKDLIDKLRELEMISPEEEISETNALNKAARERRQDRDGAFGHFVTGGSQGLRDYYQRMADAALETRSRYSAGSAEWKKADAEYKKNKEKADAIDDEIASIQATQAALDNLSKAASMLSNFFEAIAGESSNEGAAFGSISGGALGGASSLSGFGPWGMAAGAILGGATAMIQEGDKAAERAINKLRGDVQSIEANTSEILKLRERTLGYDNGKYLADLYKNQNALVSEYFANPFDSKEAEKSFHASWGASIMRDWYKELYGGVSSGYEAQYNNLIEQRKNYLAILDEQNEKKHRSDEEIAETKSKIAELDDQIMHFSQDLAKELWGIDIKGWADQLSDALASAFENGENMAKAYRDTVTSILQQMMQKMMQMQILEPMFANLQKDLFGENGKGGVFDPNNPKGSLSKVTKIIGDYFGKGGEGEKAITASMEFMTAFQRGMQNAGLTVLNEASNTLSSGIQGTSEETSDLLAGYVNALRQDVSVNRILLTQYVTQLWPQYIEAYTAQVTSVSNIDNNVRVIMEMMQLGNGAMYEQIAAMRTRIDNIVLGIDRVSIR